MLKRLMALLLVFMMMYPVVAQDSAPDYAIRNIRSRFTDSGRQTVVEFEIWNIGGEADEPATVALRVIATGQEVATDIVQPLRAQEIVTVSLTFPTSNFPSDSVQSMRVSVGIDEVELSGSETIQNNFAQISITVPPITAAETEGTTESPSDEVAAPSDLESTVAIFLRERFGIQLDLSNPIQIAVISGLCVVAGILLLIIFIVLRVIFRRPPDFSNWQPSYINSMPLDPNSIAGRRQQWETHAQNNTLPLYCTEGEYHVRKMGNGAAGTYLAGWRVDAIRIGQYDRYGRVMRSQILARKAAVRRLDAAIRKRESLDSASLSKRLHPVAKMLVNDFKKKWNERNVMLPMAVDVRLRGKYGEVRIVFELFQCRGRTWNIIDAWEPELTMTGKPIYEICTYTVFGQRPGETSHSFRSRLRDDLVTVLTEMISLPLTAPSAVPARPPSPTNPHLQAIDVEE